ncbi:MAG: agmatine deiminase family protein, partial [Clostridia bacterium]|nr:agmatine deiminase family protein [Clostridia bacterium]
MTTPKQDGFYMPAEFSEHSATIMIWCERPGSWTHGAKPARKVFAEIIKIISQGEKVYLAVSENGKRSAEEMLSEQILNRSVELWETATDDCWARDMAPTFLKLGKEVRGVDWKFNAWGGEFDG